MLDISMAKREPFINHASCNVGILVQQNHMQGNMAGDQSLGFFPLINLPEWVLHFYITNTKFIHLHILEF